MTEENKEDKEVQKTPANQKGKHIKRLRIQVIMDLLVLGYTRRAIHKEIEDKYDNWGLAYNTIDVYISDAYKLFIVQSDKQIEEARSLVFERLNDLYRMAREKKATKVALQVQQEINRCIGMYEPEKYEARTGFSIKLGYFDETEDTNDRD